MLSVQESIGMTWFEPPHQQDKELDLKELIQKMSQIMDLLKEDRKQSHKENQKLMAEKETAEKAQAAAKGAHQQTSLFGPLAFQTP
ncbi:hypothetical protein PISMIDRAFT_11122 [Pisolithus microcarpus 441]|uniref:Uncharacterized protein n=1 Tax=Pisolithus microcarpus 441 TaxID=765257 RepID=A0A0C9YE92_9AGAM|nr:hypothetical protein PISMIDRAFT_11122 [Pisolithus microcarpus 441]